MDDREIGERVERAETALAEIEALPESRARSLAIEAVQALLDLYGEGLARIMAAAAKTGAKGLPASLAQDGLVSHLLVIHDLHPLTLEARVCAALEEVRPYLKSHGGDAELAGLEEGVARVRLRGSCRGCPSSTATMRGAIEQAVRRAAPELTAVEPIDDGQPRQIPVGGFIPLTAVR